MNTLPRYWYAVVSALPDPESGDRLNVALVVGTERWARLEYIEDLPKLACLVPAADLRLFRAALQGLQERLRNPEDLFSIGPQIGPHFDISPPRELYHPPEGRSLRLLRNRFLTLAAEKRSTGRRRSVQRDASKRLDEALREGLPIGATIERTATVENLYPELSGRSVFTASVPRLNRAIRIGEYDVLIGSVVVEYEDPLGMARDASARIGQAFWQYHRAKDALREITGREVRTLGVVLNGMSDQRPEVRAAKEYVLHMWELDADRLFAPERREQEIHLAEEVERLVPA